MNILSNLQSKCLSFILKEKIKYKKWEKIFRNYENISFLDKNRLNSKYSRLKKININYFTLSFYMILYYHYFKYLE